jgi:ADP-ribose pyrophosphatase YjhB (NUDIX family)
MAENAAARGYRESGRYLAAEARREVPAETWVVSSRLNLLAFFDAQQRGTSRRRMRSRHACTEANALAARLHRRARELSDVVEMQLHSLLSPRAETAIRPSARP